MPTRFYFPASDPAGAPLAANKPDFNTSWNQTTGATRHWMTVAKGLTTLKEGTQIAIGAGGNNRRLDRQFISLPIISNTTISGTVKGQLLVREFSAVANVDSIHINLKVVSGDGTVVRGTLLAINDYGPRTEFLDTGYRNKTIADGDAVTSVNALAGDRIVLEIGYRTASGGGSGGLAAAKYGEVSKDLPENETQTTDGVGWFEFSATIPVNAVYKELGSSGVLLGGSANSGTLRKEFGSGGAVLGGTAVAGMLYSITASGGVAIQGSNVPNIVTLYVGAGGAVLGGSGIVSVVGGLNLSMSGGVVLGGSATVANTYANIGAGGVVMGGTAYSPNNIVILASGGIVLTGSAPVIHLSVALASLSSSLTISAGQPTADPSIRSTVTISSAIRPDIFYAAFSAGFEIGSKIIVQEQPLATGWFRE